jgi:N utilization substance protein A
MVGGRGVRVSTVMSELGGERIDIIEWSPDPKKFIEDALSPAKVLSVTLDENNNQAIAMVSEDQQSLAIGKGGQNVRLAAKLTGWKIDIKHPNAPVAEIKRADAETVDTNGSSDVDDISDSGIEDGPRPSLLDADERI